MARKFSEIEKEILADPERRAAIEKEKEAMYEAMQTAPDRLPVEIHAGPLYIEWGGSESLRRGKWRRDSIHIWVGPLGLHLFWPDVWKSRPDFNRDWRSSPDTLEEER